MSAQKKNDRISSNNYFLLIRKKEKKRQITTSPFFRKITFVKHENPFSFLCCFFFSLMVASQQLGKNFGCFGLGLDFPQDNTAFNFSGSLNGHIGKGPLFLGAGLQFTKFKNISGYYKPLYLNVSLIPVVKTNVFPLIVVQPGIGFFDDESWPSFFGGGGIGFSGKQRICFLAGYSNSRIKYKGAQTNLSGVAVKTIILF